jgi:putative ABC transport system ATP-binding protein
MAATRGFSSSAKRAIRPLKPPIWRSECSLGDDSFRCATANGQNGGMVQASNGNAEPIFGFEEVSVRFGAVTVVRAVSLSIMGGGITVLTGPSGAGKTTLLRLCNRLEVPTSGAVRFRGDDVGRLDPLELRRKVGMVFQRPTLFAGSLHDNFLVAGPASDSECEEALAMVGLPASWLDHPADQLSGGEAQRACLARTLITRPEVLLMDEPTSSLDDGATRTLERLGADLVDSGLTLIWVSHDLAQVRRIADHHVVMMRGEVVIGGPADEYLAGATDSDTADRRETP